MSHRLKKSLLIAFAAIIASTGIFFLWRELTNQYFAKNSDFKGKIDSYVAKVMRNNAIPGAAVAVVKEGKVIYYQSLGVADASKSGRDVTPTSNFHMASISKVLVAMAALRIAEEGKLNLERAVIDYYPGFRMDDQRSGEITVHQLLTHTSGIPDVEDYEWDKPSFDSLALARYIGTLSTKKLLFAPGEKWDYSNSAYDLLGAVVSSLANQSFEQYMKERVLTPLGMTNSTFYFPEIDSSLHLKGHVGKFKAVPVGYYPYNRGHAPSSTLQSNLSDATQFVLNTLPDADGKNKLLSEKSVKSMWKPYNKVNDALEMGLGWFIGTHNGSALYIAAGRDPGFASMIALIPEKQLGIITLTNSSIEPSIQLDFVMGILDIGQGEEKNPLASISIPIGKAYEEKGIDAAVAEYYRIQKEGSANFEMGIGELTWVVHEVYKKEKYDDALRLLDIEAKEFPRCHICLTYARIYMKKEDRNLTAEYYKKWLEYLPDQRDDEIENYLNKN